MMKLKFIPVALMLLLGFNACDTYDESSSVANMRNARAEYFKSEAAVNLAKAMIEEASAAYRNAETALKNFEAALKEAEVKAKVLANAKAEALDAIAIAEAQAAGLSSLKGHRSVGGMRASIYNAMPIEGIEALIGFMKEFESKAG